ncbi:exodeoxyribonuclease V subunit gamma [Alishewanella sp. SMS8]|uniref:exodeoxyribonuclease V subunit gamma n=1 Tax=Alishewanella sp. SMS8 TaxID=2994676 RepID=UPI002740DC47|nr:exodeoxyribonuclease V subunit gamma [Alishewanella sp. SMS8]MDP5460411.1 exodeoxyribonuclease V subunit gamma [Alishewanella sp. SMS8]
MTLTPGFIAAHSHRLEALTDLVVQLVAQYPIAPLEEEVVLVQSNGIAQWLKQALASHTGIATMLEVTLPARLVWRAYRAVLGQAIPRQSPFDKSRLRWRLLRLLPALMQQHAEFAALQSYVAEDADQRKLFQLSDKLADLFDQYQVYRADWLDAWANCQATIWHRGKAEPLAADQQWQALLWQALVQDIGAEQICSNRATLHQRFLTEAAILTATGRKPAALPPRIVVFGISSLPRQTLEVLHALKGLCQVVLCVHNPCKYHWADIVDGRELLNQAAKPRFKEKQPLTAVEQAELHQFAQPLLASWGKQGRDYIRLLDEFDETRAKAERFADLHFDLFDEDENDTLLTQLQSDILNLRPLAESQQGRQRQATDQSLLFQSCHSPQREVEVLHDQLLAAFAADPSLQPRDIMVMVPDINHYAPYIDAVFGQLAREDKRFIPYTIADQGLRQRNPILQALELVLSAPQQRFTQSDVFDLLYVPAIQQRFAINQAQVVQLQQWSQAAGARWGLDAKQRQALGLDYSFNANSWQFALDRMLYGYAAGNQVEQPWQQIEPYAEVAGIAAQAVGALANILQLLQHYWQALAQSQTPAQWHQLLQNLLDELFLAKADEEYLLLGRLRDTLDEWLSSTDEAEFHGDLRYNIVLDVWLSAVDEPNLQQRFMAGSVNFATLMPMRAIPFKRICLLGMNDQDYPRTSSKTDFDLMSYYTRPGDRSRREDDRYLFLEAMLSAREQFYISWVGQSAQDNSHLPPSVLVGQLQDHLNAVWGADCAAALTLNHRLQPFASSYFQAEADARYFSYAKEWLPLHQANTAAAAATLTPLPPYQAEAAFSLADLRILLREPAQMLARRRLGVYLERVEQAATDVEQFTADNLVAWQQRDLLLQQLLQAETNSMSIAPTLLLQQSITRLRQRGHLPYGHAADPVLADSEAAVLTIYEHFCKLRDTKRPLSAERFSLSFEGYQLEDELNSLYHVADGQLLQIELNVSKVANFKARSYELVWRNVIVAYLKHLFASAALPNQLLSTVIIGEGSMLTLSPIAADEAKRQLAHLFKLLTEALSQPLPVALSLAEAWWKKSDKDQELTEQDLSKLYLGDDFIAGEQSKLGYLARFYTDAQSLLAANFVSYCQQFYQPMFALLQQGSATKLDAAQDAGDEA